MEATPALFFPAVPAETAYRRGRGAGSHQSQVQIAICSWQFSLVAQSLFGVSGETFVFFAAIAAGLPIGALADAGQFTLVGETRKQYLNCNDLESDKRLSWAEAVLDTSAAPTGIEREGEIDGRALYEGEDILSLVEWTKPVHHPNLDKLVIHFAASDMSKTTTLRVRADITVGSNTRFGDGYAVFASRVTHGAISSGAYISSIVNQKYPSFYLRIRVSDGGSCWDDPVVYHFQRVQ